MPCAGAEAAAGHRRDAFSALRELNVSPGKYGQKQTNRINKHMGTNYNHCYTGKGQVL